MSRIPLIRLYPYHDETFYSYAVRMADANDYQRPFDIYKLTGLLYKKGGGNPNFLVIDDRTVWQQFLEISGITERDFMLKTKGNGIAYSVEIYGQTFPQYLLNKTCVKVCPLCILSQGYFRNTWQFVNVTVCPTHECLLLDACLVCEGKFRWHKNIRKGCLYCSASWDEIGKLVIKVSEDELFLTKLCYWKKGLMSQPLLENLDPEFYNMNFLELSKLLSLTSWLNPLFEKSQRCVKYYEQEDNRATHNLLMRTMDIFRDWPDRFHRFLFLLQDQRVTIINKRDKIAFTSFYIKLSKELSHSSYKFVRNAFGSFMIQSGANIKKYKKIDFSEIPQLFYNGRDVFLKYGVGLKDFRKNLKKGFFEGSETVINKKKVLIATVKSVDDFMRVQKENLSVTQVADLLGFKDRRCVFNLYKEGLIKGIRGPKIDGCGKWLFDKGSVLEVLEWFETSMILDVMGIEQLVDFHHAAMRIRGRITYIPSYSDIIRKVRDGNLFPKGKESTRWGLNQFFFNKDDLYSAFKDEVNI